MFTSQMQNPGQSMALKHDPKTEVKHDTVVKRTRGHRPCEKGERSRLRSTWIDVQSIIRVVMTPSVALPQPHPLHHEAVYPFPYLPSLIATTQSNPNLHHPPITQRCVIVKVLVTPRWGHTSELRLLFSSVLYAEQCVSMLKAIGAREEGKLSCVSMFEPSLQQMQALHDVESNHLCRRSRQESDLP